MPRGLALLLVGSALVARAVSAEPVAVRAIRIPLDPLEPSRGAIGALRYRGGLLLSSSSARFGGFSDLHVGADGLRLLAVSDEGHWLSARLQYDEQGGLLGLAEAEAGPLRGPDGSPLRGKRESDAESMAMTADGSVLVGFEGWPRIWRYPAADNPLAGRAVVQPAPPDLDKAPPNGGLEALASLPDGRVLAITEEPGVDGVTRAWVGAPGDWSPLSYTRDGSPRPTGAAALPSGGMLVLERSFSVPEGVHVRVRRIPAAAIRPGAALTGPVLAEMRPPLSVDNFEGIAVRRSPAGETLVYLISDDNFSPLQHTLLLMFAVEETAAAEPSQGRGAGIGTLAGPRAPAPAQAVTAELGLAFDRPRPAARCNPLAAQTASRGEKGTRNRE